MKPIIDYENVCKLQERIFIRVEEGTILKSDLLDALNYLDELNVKYLIFNPIVFKNYENTNDIQELIEVFNFNSISILNNIFLVLQGNF